MLKFFQLLVSIFFSSFHFFFSSFHWIFTKILSFLDFWFFDIFGLSLRSCKLNHDLFFPPRKNESYYVSFFWWKTVKTVLFFCWVWFFDFACGGSFSFVWNRLLYCKSWVLLREWFYIITCTASFFYWLINRSIFCSNWFYFGIWKLFTCFIYTAVRWIDNNR